MAAKVDGIHNHIIGNIDLKIAEMHSLMMSMATPGNSPWIGPSRQDTNISLAETLTVDMGSPMDSKPMRAPADAQEDADTLIVAKSAPQAGWMPQPLSPRPLRSRAASEAHGLEGLGISNTKQPDSNLQTPELNGSEFSPGSSPDMPNNRDPRWSDLIPANPYNLPSSTDTATKASSGSNRWSAVSDELPTVHQPDPFGSPRLIAARRPSSQYGHQTSLSPIALGSPATVDSDNTYRRYAPPSRDSSLYPADFSASNPLPVPPKPSQTQTSLSTTASDRPTMHSRRPSSPLLPYPPTLSPYTTGQTTTISTPAPITPASTLEPYSSRPWLSPALSQQSDDSGLCSPNEEWGPEASRKTPSSPNQHQSFERSIFGDAAILCEA